MRFKIKEDPAGILAVELTSDEGVLLGVRQIPDRKLATVRGALDAIKDAASIRLDADRG